MDAVLFIAGDVDALRRARRAPVLTATARELENLRRGAVELDALIGSGEDEAERYHAGDLDPEPKLVVTTSGALGGWMQPGGPFVAAPVPGPREDAYGCGDSFMAGLTFALGSGLEAHDAVAFAARCGAAALTGRGVAPQPLRSARPLGDMSVLGAWWHPSFRRSTSRRFAPPPAPGRRASSSSPRPTRTGVTPGS